MWSWLNILGMICFGLGVAAVILIIYLSLKSGKDEL